MASNLEFVENVCDSLSSIGSIKYKRMFGEYGIYFNEIFIGVICDNLLYIKPTESGKKCLGTPVHVPPYKGAKDYFLIEDFKNKTQMSNLLLCTYEELLSKKK